MNATHSNRTTRGLLSRSRSGAAILTLLLALPASVSAQSHAERSRDDAISLSAPGTKHTTPTAPGGGESLPRTAAMLAIVLAAVIGSLALARRWMPSLAPAQRNSPVDVLAQRSLGAKGTIYVLRCGPRVLFVSATASQITTLAEIADTDEIDQITALCQPGASPTRQSNPNWGLEDSTPATRDSKRAHRTDRAAPAATDLHEHVDGLLEKIHAWKSAT